MEREVIETKCTDKTENIK